MASKSTIPLDSELLVPTKFTTCQFAPFLCPLEISHFVIVFAQREMRCASLEASCHFFIFFFIY